MTPTSAPPSGLSVLPPIEEDAPSDLDALGAQQVPDPGSLAAPPTSLEELQHRLRVGNALRVLRAAERTEQQVHHAEANLNRTRQLVAALGERPKVPTTPWFLVALSAGAIALTFTLSIHDLIFADLLSSPPVALFASFVSALLISGTLVTALVQSAHLETRLSRLAGVGWVLVMLGVAAGLLVMRWSGASGPAAHGLAVGMSMLEAFLALSTERVAARLRHAWRQHRIDIEAWDSAARQVQVATIWRDDRRADHAEALRVVQQMIGPE